MAEDVVMEGCRRPDGAWSDGRCTCRLGYSYVDELFGCVNNSRWLSRCDDTGGTWSYAEARCDCEPSDTYLHEYDGCVSPTEMGTVCEATGGMLFETTDWWTCLCPDGRSVVHGRCP